MLGVMSAHKDKLLFALYQQLQYEILHLMQYTPNKCKTKHFAITRVKNACIVTKNCISMTYAAAIFISHYPSVLDIFSSQTSYRVCDLR